MWWKDRVTAAGETPDGVRQGRSVGRLVFRQHAGRHVELVLGRGRCGSGEDDGGASGGGKRAGCDTGTAGVDE